MKSSYLPVTSICTATHKLALSNVLQARPTLPRYSIHTGHRIILQFVIQCYLKGLAFTRQTWKVPTQRIQTRTLQKCKFCFILAAFSSASGTASDLRFPISSCYLRVYTSTRDNELSVFCTRATGKACRADTDRGRAFTIWFPAAICYCAIDGSFVRGEIFMNPFRRTRSQIAS